MNEGRMKKFVKPAIVTVLFLAIAGAATGLYLFNLRPRNLSKARPDFVISATDLQNEFEKDENAATAKYTGKVIEVTGEILSVKQGQNNSVSVNLKTSSAMSSVICTFPSANKPAGLAEGSNAVIHGVCSGYLMDVLLNNCALPAK